MIKASGIRRALATVVGLGLAGSLTAFASAGPASAADDHLTNHVLLSAHDLADAGWKSPRTFPTRTDTGALLSACTMTLPYWSDGFRALKRRSFQDDPLADGGLEVVVAFKTAADARAYEQDYRASVDYVCGINVGQQRWDVRSRSSLHLRYPTEHAHTWTVRDSTGVVPRNLSVTIVRVHERVALIWLAGVDDHADPARSLDLHALVQRATDRMVA